MDAKLSRSVLLSARKAACFEADKALLARLITSVGSTSISLSVLLVTDCVVKDMDGFCPFREGGNL